MAEEVSEPTSTGPDDSVSATDDAPLGDAGKRALDSERAARKEADQKAKAESERVSALEKELAKIRRTSLSESERAVEEARLEGRASAAVEFGKRLARSEFDSIAGRRNADVDTSAVLEYVDLARFVGEDGEPDSKAIAEAVERLVPESSGAAQAPPPLDLGQRSAPTRGKSTGDMFAATIQSLL